MNIGRERVYRPLMVVGLLLGLFISSGEGLRLFPIPVDFNRASSTHEPDADSPASERYNIGVRHSRSFTIAKIKISKRPWTDMSCAVARLTGSPYVTFDLFSAPDRSADLVRLSSTDFSLLPSGRAPPLS